MNVDKIDQFNQVPLIIDFQPGEVVVDDIRECCGEFTGTFAFRIDACAGVPHFLDVDCGG